jgi:hypothetical protein
MRSVLASVFLKLRVLVKTKRETRRCDLGNEEKQVGSMRVTCVEHNLKHFFFPKAIASFSKALLSFNRLLLQIIAFTFIHALHTRSTFNTFCFL